MRTLLIAATLLAAFLLIGTTTSAKDKEKVVELGKRSVDFHNDHDTIEVGKHEGHFNALRFTVKKGDMILEKMKITFGDNEKWEPDTRLEFKEGSRSRDIDLPGDKRMIKKVEFTYRSEHHGDKAEILLYGIEK